jgi:hypothetical protein
MDKLFADRVFHPFEQNSPILTLIHELVDTGTIRRNIREPNNPLITQQLLSVCICYNIYWIYDIYKYVL